MLGLHCFVRSFSRCGQWGLLFYSSLQCVGFSLLWLLLLRSMGSKRAGFRSCGSWALECRLSSCGARAYLLHGMWDLPGPGLESVSPALAGRFLTIEPPGKSQDHFLNGWLILLSLVNVQVHLDAVAEVWHRFSTTSRFNALSPGCPYLVNLFTEPWKCLLPS